MLSTFLNLIFGLLLIYFFLSVLYLFILSITGKFFYKKGRFPSRAPSKKIAIFIPAYKEDNIIVSTANSMLRLDYPRELYDVYILADSFQEESLNELRRLPLEVIEVKFEKSTKAKALNVGFNLINKKYDIALICDADNVLAKSFLRKVNDAFNANARAIQGQRVAKNMDTSYAVLDTISEGINNHIFRKGTNAIGLSSAVIGSGMAFEYNTVKKVLGEINAVGGFDRPLQLKIVKQRIKIEYLEDALIFDEKVDSLHAFKQQRKRWLSSQLVYLKEYFVPGFKQLLKGNFSYFNLGVINSIIMPRAFLILLLPLLVIVSFFINNILGGAYALTWVLFLVSMLISLPEGSFNKDLFHAILKLPGAALAMFSSMIGIKSSNKTFIHTTHSKTEVTNPLFEKYNS